MGSGIKKRRQAYDALPIKSPDGKKIFPIAPDGNDGRWRVGKSEWIILMTMT